MIAVLVVLSLILTAGVLYPDLGAHAILGILALGGVATLAGGVGFLLYRRQRVQNSPHPVFDQTARETWRMPPLALLSAPRLSTGERIGLTVLRTYLLIAMILVVVRVVQLALGHGTASA